MLVFTVKRGETVEFEMADGSKGKLTIGDKTRASRVQLVFAMPAEVRVKRESAVAVDAIPQLSSFKPCPEVLQEV